MTETITSSGGVPLKEIIQRLGNRTYSYIECRMEYKDREGTVQDVLTGACSYDSGTGQLLSLDGESYSLSDCYHRWEESHYLGYHSGKRKYSLTVWTYAESHANDNLNFYGK